MPFESRDYRKTENSKNSEIYDYFAETANTFQTTLASWNPHLVLPSDAKMIALGQFVRE